MGIKNNKAQSELITTVLLILISIAAVVLVSTFVLNMVRQNLQGTDCFKTSGQLSIDLTSKYTYYNPVLDEVSVTIDRGEKDFNLTGLSISVGSAAVSKSYVVRYSGSDAGISAYGGATLTLPGLSETRTYIINVASANLGTITNVKIAPIIYPNKLCQEGVDEQTIPTLSE